MEYDWFAVRHPAIRHILCSAQHMWLYIHLGMKPLAVFHLVMLPARHAPLSMPARHVASNPPSYPFILAPINAGSAHYVFASVTAFSASIVSYRLSRIARSRCGLSLPYRSLPALYQVVYGANWLQCMRFSGDKLLQFLTTLLFRRTLLLQSSLQQSWNGLSATQIALLQSLEQWSAQDCS